MAHLYFSAELGEPTPGSTVTLRGAEARHAVTVSRLGVAEQILIGDGAGMIVSGTVHSADPSLVSVTVERVDEHPRPSPAIWLAQALAKADRDELAIQAATELGIDGVIPWAASRSIVRWNGEKVAKGAARWGVLVREASKQAVRARIPDVAPLATTNDLAARAATALILVLEPTAPRSLATLEIADTVSEIVLVVGPEGGVSPAELSQLQAAGAIPVKLGREVLRTSTAGPAALSVLSAKLGRW